MKYTAIISADEPLTEDIIQDFKDTMFFGDDPAYAFEIEDIKLEQDPTTKNDLGVDCISRQAVERIINKWLSHPDYELKDHIYSMTEKIHNLSPVTPQPRKGLWTIDRVNVRCSCCGRGYKDYYGKARISNYNYCPNCGAKMESEDHK